MSKNPSFLPRKTMASNNHFTVIENNFMFSRSLKIQGNSTGRENKPICLPLKDTFNPVFSLGQDNTMKPRL